MIWDDTTLKNIEKLKETNAKLAQLGLSTLSVQGLEFGKLMVNSNQIMGLKLEKLAEYYSEKENILMLNIVKKLKKLEILKEITTGRKDYYYKIRCNLSTRNVVLFSEGRIFVEKKEINKKTYIEVYRLLMEAGYINEVEEIKLLEVFLPVQANKILLELVSKYELENFDSFSELENDLLARIIEIKEELEKQTE